MSVRSFIAISLSTIICLLTSALAKPALAIEPFAPYSTVGNPTEDYHLNHFFPLLRYIDPNNLVVYENQEQNRTYRDLHPCEDTRPSTCTNTQACRGVVQYCDSSGSILQKKTVTGTCSGLDPNKDDSSGTCSYPEQTPKIIVDPQATDFSRDSSSSTIDSENSSSLVYPKYQNESLRYQNPGGGNSVTWGTHYLTLDRCTRAARQLMVAYQAYETKTTVKDGEWPLGWVDWGYQTRDRGKSILTVWDEITSAEPNLARIGKNLVDAQDAFFLALGTESPTLPETQTSVQELCSMIGRAPADTPWIRSLELLPLYPPSFRQGYVRTSICVWNICKPGENSSLGQGLYADISIHSALSAAINDLLLTYRLSESTQILNELAQHNPLIRYMLISKSLATPSRISQALTDPLSNLKPFTFASLGHVYDYQELMDQYGYKLQPSQSLEEGNAFPGSTIANFINFSYGIVDSIAPVSNHLLTIPEPMGQAINQVQKPVYDTRDTSNNLKDLAVSTLSNVIDGGSVLLYAAKGIGPGDAKRRMAYFTCQDPEYSSPNQTSVKDYALGTRIGCYAQPAPQGKCDGSMFAQLLTNDAQYPLPPTLTNKAQAEFASKKSLLTPELLNIYGAAAAVTGVPCEILAGIHYVEADLDPQKSLVSGRAIGASEPDAGGRIFSTLLETAVYAGNSLKDKSGGNLNEVGSVITALSRYNGGGNSNCQAGYPYPIPYTSCPAKFEGEDDIYPMSALDERHLTMYLLYCDDLTACAPVQWDRIGVLPFAIEMYHNLTNQTISP